MNIEASEEEIRRAKKPHDLFIFNLIGNHILIFVGTLSIASDFFEAVLIVPAISTVIFIYTMASAKKALIDAPWFVSCHWQLALKRTKALILMLLVVLSITAIGFIMFYQFGIMKEAVIAFVGAIGLLPLMVTILILIIMESDSLNQVRNGFIPDNIAERFPKK